MNGNKSIRKTLKNRIQEGIEMNYCTCCLLFQMTKRNGAGYCKISGHTVNEYWKACSSYFPRYVELGIDPKYNGMKYEVRKVIEL